MGVTKTTTTKQMNSEMNANNATTLHPTTWEELRTIIEYELERQGQDADLNHIDVSGVTDMSDLFRELDIRHIKIDKWDVSSILHTEYITGMFTGATSFKGDPSVWNVPEIIQWATLELSRRNVANVAFTD